MTARTLTGLYIEATEDILTLAVALDYYERHLWTESRVYLPPHVVALRSELRAHLPSAPGSAPGPRRAAHPVRTPQVTEAVGGATVVTVNAAADILAIAPQNVRKSIYAGRLVATKSGRSWLISADSVNALAASRNATRP